MDGEDIPGFGWDDIGGDEVELVGLVGDVARADGADVGMLALVLRAFHLNAEKVPVAFYGEVVGGIVSPRLGDAQALFGGAGHETEFGPFAARLGVAEGGTGNCHLFGAWMNWRRKTRPLRAAWVFLVSIFSISSWVG